MFMRMRNRYDSISEIWPGNLLLHVGHRSSIVWEKKVNLTYMVNVDAQRTANEGHWVKIGERATLSAGESHTKPESAD